MMDMKHWFEFEFLSVKFVSCARDETRKGGGGELTRGLRFGQILKTQADAASCAHSDLEKGV